MVSEVVERGGGYFVLSSFFIFKDVYGLLSKCKRMKIHCLNSYNSCTYEIVCTLK